MSKPMNNDQFRDAKRGEMRREMQGKRRGRLSIKTPVVKDEAQRLRWFGVPPTPLEKPVWRASSPF